MKNSILLTLSLCLVVFTSYAQLSINPNEVFAKCPNEWIGYTVTNAVNAACTYDWQVTNGEIQGGFLNGNTSTFSGGNFVQIRWFDNASGGEIQILARDCAPTTGNSNETWQIPILSINGVNPGTITGPSAVTVNVTSNQVYEIPQINFPNVGTGDPDPRYQAMNGKYQPDGQLSVGATQRR